MAIEATVRASNNRFTVGHHAAGRERPANFHNRFSWGDYSSPLGLKAPTHAQIKAVKFFRAALLRALILKIKLEHDVGQQPVVDPEVGFAHSAVFRLAAIGTGLIIPERIAGEYTPALGDTPGRLDIPALLDIGAFFKLLDGVVDVSNELTWRIDDTGSQELSVD